MTDQLRGDCLSFAGHKEVQTPYLDTLAAKGIQFDRAYSSCPSCIAARAALHTGLSQRTHGRLGYEDNIPWNYKTTLAGELGKGGYYTQCVGKMHVHPLRSLLGFHHVELHDGYLHHYRKPDTPYYESQLVADDYFYWLKTEKGVDTDVTDSGMECNSWVARPWIYEEKYHPTNWVTSRSIDFLRRRDTTKPFFLMASYLRPHPPFDAPACYFDLYRNQTLTPPFIGTWETREQLQEKGRIYDSSTGPISEQMIREAQIGYYACITHLDHQIGRLLQYLIEHQIYENSIILFTSDHGEELCDHHLFRKSRPYEGSTHIPLILSGKEEMIHGKQNQVNHALAELRDVLPTILDLANLPIPDQIEGKSLLSSIKENPVKIRDWLHGEHTLGEASNHWIVTEKEKYIWYSQTGIEQFFDLSKDPHELENKIRDTEYQDRIEILRKHLISVLKDSPEGYSDGHCLLSGKQTKTYLF